MIYILQKSKKSDWQKKRKLSISEAKEFLYDISARDFKISEFYVFSSDSFEETDELIRFFDPRYLIPTEEDMFDVYRVNEEIKRNNRLGYEGASITALRNFVEKIEEAIPESNVHIRYNNDNFELFLEHETGDVLIKCDYTLTITAGFAANHEGKYVDVQKNDVMIKKINDIFRKQRYYYKRKVEENVVKGD